MLSRAGAGRAGLMKWAVAYERHRPAGWVRMQTARVAEFRKPCLRSFSAALAPANWHHNLHAFFMTRVGWQALSLCLFLPLSFAAYLCSSTHTHTHKITQTESSTHHHTFFHSQLSYLPKPSKTISLTNSLPNSEWHFILRRRRGQKDTEVDKRKYKMRLNESRKMLLKACHSALSLWIIAATLLI